MNYKKLLVLISVLIVAISGCSSSTNKANLDEEVFGNGSKLVQDLYKAINGEDTETFKESQKWLIKKHNSGEYASEEEELFISDLSLILTIYDLYSLKVAYEKFSGEDDDSENSKARIEEKMLEMKDRFGVKIKD